MSEPDPPRTSSNANPPARSNVTLEAVGLALAEHLSGKQRHKEAADLLSQLMSNNPRGVTIQSVLALARLVYLSKNWEQAAELWNLVLAEAPRNLEALIKRAHCLVELNDTMAAARATERLRELLKEPSLRPVADELDSLLDLVYRCFFTHFENADDVKCQALLEVCGLPGSYAGAIGRCAQDSQPGLSDEQIINRIDRAFEQWHDNPKYLEAEAAAAVGLPVSTKTTVLLVFRQYFLGGSNSREHELTVFLRESAKALGFRVLFFPAAVFHLGDRVTAEQQYEALDNLLRGLLTMRPQLVLFDELCRRRDPAPRLDREVYRNTLLELRKKLGFKLVAYYPDPWVPDTLEAIEYVSEFVDLVWHQNVALARRSSKAHADKLFPAPIPYLDSVFQSGAGPRTIGAGFLGSVYSYNYLRAIWCTLIRNRGVPCQLFIASHIKGGSPAGDTIEEYGSFLSRMRIMVNFSARTPSLKIITGRVWESIAAKALLLEEENEEILHYFVPFVHYVPFKNIVELDAYIRFFERHESLRQRIVEEAFAWFQRRYSQKRVWHQLFEAAFSGSVRRLTLSP